MGDFDQIKDYKAEKVVDNYAPLKGNFECNVNHIRIEEYSGDKEDFKGHKFLRYELQVVDGAAKGAGRRLWKSVDLSDATEDNKGKTKLKKLADAFFTLGLDISSEAEERSLQG